MGFIKGIINAVADPRLFFMLAVGLLALVVWKREKVASDAVGYGSLGLIGAFFIFGDHPHFGGEILAAVLRDHPLDHRADIGQRLCGSRCGSPG